MTDIVVSPKFPRWVLDTFEGKLIAHWIAFAEIGSEIEFAGDTENEDDEDVILLQMRPEEVVGLANLADQAGTSLGADVARILRDPEGSEILNEFFGKIDITAVRCALERDDESGDRKRMLEVDDLLASLVSRFPSEIPFAEVTWARGATLITPDGVEWFEKAGQRDARRQDYEASLGVAMSSA